MMGRFGWLALMVYRAELGMVKPSGVAWTTVGVLPSIFCGSLLIKAASSALSTVCPSALVASSADSCFWASVDNADWLDFKASKAASMSLSAKATWLMVGFDGVVVIVAFKMGSS